MSTFAIVLCPAALLAGSEAEPRQTVGEKLGMLLPAWGASVFEVLDAVAPATTEIALVPYTHVPIVDTVPAEQAARFGIRSVTYWFDETNRRLARVSAEIAPERVEFWSPRQLHEYVLETLASTLGPPHVQQSCWATWRIDGTAVMLGIGHMSLVPAYDPADGKAIDPSKHKPWLECDGRLRADPPAREVSLRLVAPFGRPLAKRTVHLVKPWSSRAGPPPVVHAIRTGETDMDGRIRFEVPVGTYRVIVEPFHILVSDPRAYPARTWGADLVSPSYDTLTLTAYGPSYRTPYEDWARRWRSLSIPFVNPASPPRPKPAPDLEVARDAGVEER